MTGRCYHPFMGGYETLDPEDFMTTRQNYEVYTMPHCFLGESIDPNPNGTKLWESPSLSLPDALTSFDPAWSTCSGFAYGAFDPPHALTRALALTPSITGSGSFPKVTAAPQASVINQHAKMTAIATPTRQQSDPKISPGQANDPTKPKKSAEGASLDPENPSEGTAGGEINHGSTESPGKPADPTTSPDQNGHATPPNQAEQDIESATKSPVEGTDKEENKEASKHPKFSVASNGPAGDSSHEQNDPKWPQNSDKVIKPSLVDPESADPTSEPFAKNEELSIEAGPNGGLVLGGHTLTAGARTTLSGVAVSVGASHVIVDGITYARPTSTAAGVSVAGLRVEAINNNRFLIEDSITLSAGGIAATVSGTVLSILPNSNGIIINGSTVFLPASNMAQSIFTAVGEKMTAKPHEVVFGTNTLFEGGPALTISGTKISLGTSGLQIGSSTKILPMVTAPPYIFKIGDKTVAANPSEAIIGSITISSGSPALTIAGTVVSFGALGLQMISPTGSSPTATATQSVLTIAGQLVTANEDKIPIGTVTLSRNGPALTISGTRLSLGDFGLQIGSSTIPLKPTSSANMGALILSALGPGDPTNTTSSPQIFEGKGQISQTQSLVARLLTVITISVCVLNFIGDS